MRAASIALLLMIASSIAQAQPPSATPPIEGRSAKQSSPRKNRDKATLLAVGGTVAPIVLVGAGMSGRSEGTVLVGLLGAIFLPSAGHWYSGSTGGVGIGIRAAGGALATLSLATLIASEGDASNAETYFWVGAGTFVVGVIYDIVTASSAADDWNRKHADLQPTVMRTDSGYGVGLGGSF